MKRSFNKIANWLNFESYLIIRGKIFKSSYVHSIIKKKRMSDIKVTKRYKSRICNFSIIFVDRTLVG